MGSLARVGSEARPGVSDGGRPPVGGPFRQPDRTPFSGFLLTPAFGLRSLRKNGYVPWLHCRCPGRPSLWVNAGPKFLQLQNLSRAHFALKRGHAAETIVAL